MTAIKLYLIPDHHFVHHFVEKLSL